MTYAPQTLKDLMALWVAQGGANGGIVGDAAHAARPTYHNGWDRAVARYGTTDMAAVASRDYTFKFARDQVKSDAAMGIDLSWPTANKAPLFRFSSWLVEQCKAGKCPDIREVIWSPDGRVVKHWNAPYGRVYDGYPVSTGHGDSSHLWHTHISFYRDSESRDKVSLFAPYFTATEEAVISFPVPEKPTLVYLKPDPADPAKSVWLYRYSDFRADAGNIQLKPNRPLPYVGGWGAATDAKSVRIVAYEPTVEDANASSSAMFVKAPEVAKYELVPAPTVPVDESPYTQAQVDVLTKQSAKAAAADVAQNVIGAATAAAGKYP